MYSLFMQLHKDIAPQCGNCWISYSWSADQSLTQMVYQSCRRPRRHTQVKEILEAGREDGEVVK